MALIRREWYVRFSERTIVWAPLISGPPPSPFCLLSLSEGPRARISATGAWMMTNKEQVEIPKQGVGNKMNGGERIPMVLALN